MVHVGPRPLQFGHRTHRVFFVQLEHSSYLSPEYIASSFLGWSAHRQSDAKARRWRSWLAEPCWWCPQDTTSS